MNGKNVTIKLFSKEKSVLISLISDTSLSGDYILNGFLANGAGTGACSVYSMHRPGIAVFPGTV
ncbi:MAG: hypothetical protein ACRC38_06180, partial [Plesiomonas sp.]